VTKRTARNLFLLALALVTLLALVLQGCATEYTWKRIVPACENYSWTVVARRDLPEKCKPAQMYGMSACTRMYPTCEVYSFMSEEQAKRTMSADGLTLWEHERLHILGATHK
jgi:hypothetical protein